MPAKPSKKPNVKRPKQYTHLRQVGLSHDTAKKIAGPKKGKGK